ncbi:uncharacterized protein EKO05_0006935 [Ascochyta rabiei]|uniref:Short-chain dehydrogenase/reductase 3 n=1 Tax=Didymella rabiei TaxID=5454 RepID=A0A162Z383_DIDRA|nr:uncharacterized protein EKO05_0006935 [Ascochyta rabiei]KZM20375.1 oxidoreductase [Ascochyta rabiei]UPX16541.1 hypothetical protein EKO05_0006935 [Ascochyta rabiei]
MTFLRSVLSDRLTIALFLSLALFKVTLPRAPDRAYYYSAGLRTLQSAIYTAIGVKLLLALNKWITHRSINNFIDDTTWDWPKELAVITGGSSGIGAETVRGLSKHNVKTIILDINPPTSKQLNGVTFYQVNLTSTSAIIEAAAKIIKEHGHPSILINNAGTGTAQTILSESEPERRRVFEVNSLCHFTLVREFLPAMIERNHGHIVTVASTGSFYSQAQNVSYACSKASAMAFHEGLGQEIRARFNAPKIRTSIIYPDFVRTPLVEALTSKVSEFPLNVLEPAEVAEEIVDIVLSTYSHSLVLPRDMTYLSLLRGLPLWLLRIVQTLDPDPLALANR